MQKIKDILIEIMALFMDLGEAIRLVIVGLFKIVWHLVFTTPKNIVVGMWNTAVNIGKASLRVFKKKDK